MPKAAQPRRPRTNLSLRAVRIIQPTRDRNGLRVRQPDKVYRHKALVEQAATFHARQKAREEGTHILQSNSLTTDKLITAMSTEQRQALETLISSSKRQSSKRQAEVPFDATLDDVLEGTEPLEISNGGQEFIDLARDINASRATGSGEYYIARARGTRLELRT